MLIYVRSTKYPHRSFTVRAHPFETVARVRTQLLHILYEAGKEDHQFRLRFKGEYLRDSYTLDDYNIMDNAVITMVSLDKEVEDIQSPVSHRSSRDSPSLTLQILHALEKEVKHLNQRESIIRGINTILNIYGVLLIFLLFTTYWYSIFPFAFVWLVTFLFCPAYSRHGGYTGQISLYKTTFCIGAGILFLAAMGGSVFLGTSEWLMIPKCEVSCPRVYYSGIIYCIQAVFLLITDIMIWILLWNIKLEIGYLVEKELVRSRDIEELMKAARKGSVKERRLAAFEMATLASSGDDNKFRIVAEGGLDVLLQMAVCNDSATQEYTVETLTELLTIPAIQDTFVNIGGLKTLTALLHSTNCQLVYDTAVALSSIVADSDSEDDSKTALLADQGLDDLCHAANTESCGAQQVIAGIFLELAFSRTVRAQMAARNTPAQALITLCQSTDPETQRCALQTLELLALESSEMICAQESLLHLLLALPSHTLDEHLYLLAGKILLYFAENRKTCEKILNHPDVKQSLRHFANTSDPILHKVIVKVIYCALEFDDLKAKCRLLSLDTILIEIKNNARDREVWDMADQALRDLLSHEVRSYLPTLTTQMAPSLQQSGSTVSLSSLSKPPL